MIVVFDFCDCIDLDKQLAMLEMHLGRMRKDEQKRTADAQPPTSTAPFLMVGDDGREGVSSTEGDRRCGKRLDLWKSFVASLPPRNSEKQLFCDYVHDVAAEKQEKLEGRAARRLNPEPAGARK